VGREKQVSVLADGVRAAAAGVGSCVIVDGPAGIGKSRLLAAAAAQARALGMAVASAGATELDHVAPLVALLTALRSSDPPMVEDAADLGGPSTSRFWVVDRLAELVEKYASTRSVLIVLDDTQWVDELTALALRMLVPTLASSPVMWLLGVRPVSGRSPGQDAVNRLLEAGAHPVTLRPLAEPDVITMCTNLLGARPDGTVRDLAARAGGNPFLVEEALTSLREEGHIVVRGDTATAVVRDLPLSFLTFVEHRLQGLSSDVRRLLGAGCVLGRRFTVHEAAGLLGRRPIELVDVAEEAIRADTLVDMGTELAFRHDLIREAVYNTLSGPARQALHREAATVLEAEGRSPLEIAEHLVRCGPHGTRRAVEVVHRAVVEVAPTAPGTAADLIVRVLDLLGPADQARPSLVVDAVRLLASVGRLTEARELGEALLRTGIDPRTESALLLGLADALKHAGQDTAVVEYTGRALARAGSSDEVRAEMLAIRAHALLNVGDPDEARAAADRAVAASEACDAYSAWVYGLVAQSVVAQVAGDIKTAVSVAHAAVDLADRTGGEARHRHPRLWLGHALTVADRFTEAAAVYEAGQREADQLGTAWSQPLWHYYRAELWVAKGMLDDAVAEAEAGVQIAEQLAALALSVPLLGTLAYVRMRRGDLTGAGRLLEKARRLAAEGIGSRAEDLTWRLALFQFAGGHRDAAVETLAPLLACIDRRHLLLIQEPNAGPQMVRMLRGTRSAHLAASVVDALTTLAARNPDVLSLTGAVAHAAGLLRGDIDLLRQALSTCEHSPRVLAVAPLLEDIARAEQRAGARGAAAQLFARALHHYENSGAGFDAARVHRYLGGLGVAGRRQQSAPMRQPKRERASGALTPSELKVAAMVAEGKTNREAAAELFLSPHTVDSHLRHIFAKLGMSSRVALTRWVIENGAGQSAVTMP
jgi:DNA-binding CsgD family transcriptional regulator